MINLDGSTNPVYAPFASILTIPDKMNGFPRTIFNGGKDKHYDMITWHERDNTVPVLTYQDCGYFDLEVPLRPGYGLTKGSFSTTRYGPGSPISRGLPGECGFASRSACDLVRPDFC